jgi:hypothetical protein
MAWVCTALRLFVRGSAFRRPWAVFGGVIFNAGSPQTLSQKIESFLNLWGATSPMNASNIRSILQTDSASRAAFDKWRATRQGSDPIPLNTRMYIILLKRIKLLCLGRNPKIHFSIGVG